MTNRRALVLAVKEKKEKEERKKTDPPSDHKRRRNFFLSFLAGLKSIVPKQEGRKGEKGPEPTKHKAICSRISLAGLYAFYSRIKSSLPSERNIKRSVRPAVTTSK